MSRNRRDHDGFDATRDVVVDQAGFFVQLVLGVAHDHLGAQLVGRRLHARLHGLHEGVGLEDDAGDQRFLARGFGRFFGDFKDGVALGVHELLDQGVVAAAKEDGRRVRHRLDRLATQHLEGGFEGVVAHLVGGLAGHTLQDVVIRLQHLAHLIVHVGAKDEDLARQTECLDGVGMGHGAALVGRPQQVDVGVGLQHRLRNRLGLVSQPAGLIRHDFHTRQRAHLSQEAFLARGAALELVAVEDADLSLAAELVGDKLCRGSAALVTQIRVLGHQEAGGDGVVVDAGVEAEDDDACILCFLQGSDGTIRRDGGDDDGLDPAGDVVIDQAGLFVQLVLGVAHDHLDPGFVRRRLHACLHGLHEGVGLEDDAGDEGLAFGRGSGRLGGGGRRFGRGCGGRSRGSGLGRAGRQQCGHQQQDENG